MNRQPRRSDRGQGKGKGSASSKAMQRKRKQPGAFRRASLAGSGKVLVPASYRVAPFVLAALVLFTLMIVECRERAYYRWL